MPGTEYADELAARIRDAGTVTTTFATSAGAGSAKIDTTKHNLRLDVTGGQGPVSLLRVGAKTWVKGAGVVDGKPWLQLDPAGADDISKALGDVNALVNRVDPSIFPRLFVGSVGDKSAGPGSGSVIRWQIGAAQFLEVMGATAAQRSSITKPVTMSLALDAVGLPTSLDVAYVVAGETVNDRTTFRSWGTPVDLVAPVTDEVAPAPGSSATATPSSTKTSTASAKATSTKSARATSSASASRRATSTRSARATSTADATSSR